MGPFAFTQKKVRYPTPSGFIGTITLSIAYTMWIPFGYPTPSGFIGTITASFPTLGRNAA